VARPSEAELSEIPHHFIASHSIQEDITAAYFEQYALEKTRELFRQHQVIIMVGGTGLYLKAFCEGLDKIPEIDRMVRQRIVTAYEEHGIGWLQKELSEKDPKFSMEGEMQNPQRMMRALEVFDGTGHSIFSFRKNQKAARDFNMIKIGLDLPREKLYDNINLRVDKMIGAGLLEEARSLLPFRHLNALQTVGYSEIFDFLDGKTSFEKAVELIKTNTRQYARRQLTWFRKDPGISWVAPGELEKIITTTYPPS
jgi:tRNA dimethylallyltransferase